MSNLLEILAACERDQPDAVALRFSNYGEVKDALATAVQAALAPIQERYAELAADPSQLDQVRRDGADRARDRAARTVSRAKHAIGL